MMYLLQKISIVVSPYEGCPHHLALVSPVVIPQLPPKMMYHSHTKIPNCCPNPNFVDHYMRKPFKHHQFCLILTMSRIYPTLFLGKCIICLDHLLWFGPFIVFFEIRKKKYIRIVHFFVFWHSHEILHLYLAPGDYYLYPLKNFDWLPNVHFKLFCWEFF